MPKLIDPLARWRTAWRWLGVFLLLLNCTAQCADSWARYRCDEAGPLLHVESCSDYGRHRAHIASGLGTAVQVFSLGELMLGLGTAHALPSASPSLLRYGTSVGPTSVVLFGIDGLLLLSARPGWRLLEERLRQALGRGGLAHTCGGVIDFDRIF